MKVGDTVRFLNEEGEGILKEYISALKARVEISGGMEIEVAVKELVPLTANSYKLMANSSLKLRSKEPKALSLTPNSLPLSKSHATTEMLVDLHIDKLRENHYNLSNAEMLDIQVKYFQKKLEMAVTGHFNKIIFIHGVGNGVLRQAIRDLLKNYEGMEYSDASYQKFGAGATEVRILSRNKSKRSL